MYNTIQYVHTYVGCFVGIGIFLLCCFDYEGKEKSPDGGGVKGGGEAEKITN